MSEDQKTREATQPEQQPAPASEQSKDTKDQPEAQYNFHDWAAI